MITWKRNDTVVAAAAPPSLPPRVLSNSARQVLQSGASLSWLLIVAAAGFFATGTCFAVCGPSEPLVYRLMGFAVLGIVPAAAALAAAALARRLCQTISAALDPAERELARYIAAAIPVAQHVRNLIRLRWLLLMSRQWPIGLARVRLAPQILGRRGVAG